MIARITPGVPKGSVRPPCSKSQAHRALFCALYSRGESRVAIPDMSEDIWATVRACQAFGAKTEYKEGLLTLAPGQPAKGDIAIDCGQSGSTLRFAIPYALTLGRPVTFTGQGRLMERPLEAYRLLCQNNGYDFDLSAGRLTLCGHLAPGSCQLENVVSSQFVSGLMMALGSFEEKSRIIFGRAPSAPYIAMTAGMMASFGQKAELTDGSVTVGGGMRAAQVTIEADWSQAALWAAMGAVHGDVTCLGLDPESLQGDRYITEYLASAGGNIDGLRFRRSPLKGGQLSCLDHPDLAPIIAAIGPYSSGDTVITDAHRLADKESDRAAGIVDIINSLGGRAEKKEDTIVIHPSAIKGGRVSCHGDHRLAMTAAILACWAREATEITGAQAVNKSYPALWEDLASLGVEVELYEEA